jgi:hypothetical protein
LGAGAVVDDVLAAAAVEGLLWLVVEVHAARHTAPLTTTASTRRFTPGIVARPRLNRSASEGI